jgi:hypothetical protein
LPAVSESRCRSCGAAVTFSNGNSANKCQACGRWLRLPRSPWLESLNEMPALGASQREDEGFPWLQLSPSIAFILSILLIGLGLAVTSAVVVLCGSAVFVGSFIAAAVLEFRADRQTGGLGGAHSALSMSSDWAALRSRRR